jgi:hypothetical protein
MPSKDAYLEEPGVPDSVQRVGKVLNEVVDTEIPPLDGSDIPSFVWSVREFEHPFGQAYRRIYDTATSNFEVIRLRKACIETGDPDDWVNIQAFHPDRGGRLAFFSVAMYVDGTTRVDSEVTVDDDSSLKVLIKTDRTESLTQNDLRESIKSVTHPDLE